MSKKVRPIPAKMPKKRNFLSLNPLMKKSHAHSKNRKAERAQDKQTLKKEMRED